MDLNARAKKARLTITKTNFQKIKDMEIEEMAIQALEKQMPKIPNVWGDGYDDKGNMIYDMYSCPNCGKNYEIDYDHYEYCPKCVQHMDKSDKVFE